MILSDEVYLLELKNKLQEAEKNLTEAHDAYRAAEEECEKLSEAYQEALDNRG